MSPQAPQATGRKSRNTAQANGRGGQMTALLTPTAPVVTHSGKNWKWKRSSMLGWRISPWYPLSLWPPPLNADHVKG